jgi:hypothetical protein
MVLSITARKQWKRGRTADGDLFVKINGSNSSFLDAIELSCRTARSDRKEIDEA